MLGDIFIITLLFLSGFFLGSLSVIIGMKLPLREKCYFNICDNCNSRYNWNELIPLVSFFLNRGKCKHCNKKLSFWNFLLQLISGVLFSLSYVNFGFSYEFIIMLILTMLSVVIFVSDFKYYVISSQPLIIFSIIVLVLKFIFFDFKTLFISVCSGIFIFVFMLVIKFIGDQIFKQESIGGGDIKLSMFFGFVLGIRLSVVALIIGSFFAFPYAIYSVLTNMQREIPFGPFLISGLYFVFLFMEQINNFLSIIF